MTPWYALARRVQHLAMTKYIANGRRGSRRITGRAAGMREKKGEMDREGKG